VKFDILFFQAVQYYLQAENLSIFEMTNCCLFLLLPTHLNKSN